MKSRGLQTGLWMKREIAKSRAWIETEARQRSDFFLGFMFEPRNRRERSNFAQTRSRSRREDFSSVRDPARSLIETNTHTAHLPTPPKNPYLVCWCTLSGTCVDQMVRGWGHCWPNGEGMRSPHPLSPAPPPHPPHPPPLFPPPTPHFLNSSVCLGKHYFRPTNFCDPENWGVFKL